MPHNIYGAYYGDWKYYLELDDKDNVIAAGIDTPTNSAVGKKRVNVSHDVYKKAGSLLSTGHYDIVLDVATVSPLNFIDLDADVIATFSLPKYQQQGIAHVTELMNKKPNQYEFDTDQGDLIVTPDVLQLIEMAGNCGQAISVENLANNKLVLLKSSVCKTIISRYVRHMSEYIEDYVGAKQSISAAQTKEDIDNILNAFASKWSYHENNCG